jgi:hypothetical protein
LIENTCYKEKKEINEEMAALIVQQNLKVFEPIVLSYYTIDIYALPSIFHYM